MATNAMPRALDPRELHALTAAVGLHDRSERGKLAVTGPDGAVFLDSLLSNDIAALEVGDGAQAALLTHKGRMLADVRVLRLGDEYWLDTERPGLQALFDALRQFRIGYDAELHKRTLERSILSLIGPQTDALLHAVAPGRAEHATVAGEFAGMRAVAARTDLGIDLICDSADAPALAAALRDAGVLEVSEDAVECLRIETGRPRFGIDIDETTMPQEAGINQRAVSYTKGCYVGQETVARLYWKGKPNRHLRGLRLSGVVPRATALRRGETGVGQVSSVALSPRFGPIGIALLRREAQPGDALAFADRPGSATVVELPFA